MRYKRVVAGLGAAAALSLGVAAPGAAQLVPFQGTTQACFYFSPATTCTPVTSNTFVGSTYNAANINGGNLTTTVSAPGGLLYFTNGSFSFNVSSPGSQQFQLGMFSFGVTNPVSIVNAFFVLAVNLTSPTTGQTVFTSTVTGQLKGLVSQNGVGSVVVDFNPSGPGLNWTSAPVALPGGGTYTLSALGGNFFSDKLNQPLMGVATVTPEPVSMMLFGTGLGGLALLRRRRKKTPEQQDA